MTLRTTSNIRGKQVLIIGGEKGWDAGKGYGGFDGLPQRTAKAFKKWLHSGGVNAELIIMPGIGHSTPQEFVPQVQDWITRKVQDKAPL